MAGLIRAITCKEARFDLDLYGRLYIPNVLTYRVTLVDNAGNVIFKAGHYGNADSQGPGPSSPVPAPAVPLGWPMTVGTPGPRARLRGRRDQQPHRVHGSDVRRGGDLPGQVASLGLVIIGFSFNYRVSLAHSFKKRSNKLMGFQ